VRAVMVAEVERGIGAQAHVLAQPGKSRKAPASVFFGRLIRLASERSRC
jgi:hypothetical protein